MGGKTCIQILHIASNTCKLLLLCVKAGDKLKEKAGDSVVNALRAFSRHGLGPLIPLEGGVTENESIGAAPIS